MMTPPPIAPDDPIAEAGRRLMAEELAIMQDHWPALRLSADMTAVHETRKAIRRSLTLFQLFAPYFAPEMLTPHRATLRGIMRRLAPCRDMAVFRLKLAAYNATAAAPLAGLALLWDERQVTTDARLCAYLGRKSIVHKLHRYTRLVTSPGMGLPKRSRKGAPLLVRHALPELLFARIAAVRAWGDRLPDLSPRQFHQLRIQFKELRYTLGFFEPLLVEIGAVNDLSRRIQEHLGLLNDASVGVELLADVKRYPDEAAAYEQFLRGELARLTAGFLPLYAEFDRPEVRRALALAVVTY